jgi:hypothetical protein
MIDTLHYSEWFDSNEEYLLNAYIESLDTIDLPSEYVDELKTDDSDEWDAAFIRWTETLTADDIPDDFVLSHYEDYQQGVSPYDERI